MAYSSDLCRRSSTRMLLWLFRIYTIPFNYVEDKELRATMLVKVQGIRAKEGNLHFSFYRLSSTYISLLNSKIYISRDKWEINVHHCQWCAIQRGNGFRSGCPRANVFVISSICRVVTL